MRRMQGSGFAFGSFVLDAGAGTLLRNGVPLAISHRGLKLLAALAGRPGEILTKSELIASLQNEVRILLHLCSKIEPQMLDYRPTPKQRSTMDTGCIFPVTRSPRRNSAPAATATSASPLASTYVGAENCRSPPLSATVRCWTRPSDASTSTTWAP